MQATSSNASGDRGVRVPSETAAPVAYEASVGRAALALAAGAFVGAALSVIGVGASKVLPPYPSGRMPSSFAVPVDLMLRLFFPALVIFAAGLLLAVPAWWLAHRSGRRGCEHAVLMGGVLSAVAMFAGNAILELPHASLGREWPSWFRQAAEMSVIGGIVGMVIWRIAYRTRTASQWRGPRHW
jgi:hypothetical protein